MARTASRAAAVRAADAIEAELAAAGTPERAVQKKAYLKSDLQFLGASMPVMNRVVATFAKGHPELAHDEVIALAEVLWAPPVHERRAAAVELLTRYADLLDPGDVALLERLLRQSRTWALVDGLSASVVAVLVERHPGRR